MPITPVVKPPYPNVPNLPGVPALPRSPNFPPVVQAALGFGEGILWQMLSASPNWGIFLAGTNTRLVNADSVLTVGLRAEAKISKFQVEQHAFADYNKVQLPDLPTVQLTKGGTVGDRQAFLADIDAAKKSTLLVDVLTPEKVYRNCNISSYNYQRRSSDTANFLIIEIHLEEIRQVASSYTTATVVKNPAAAAANNGGKVQPAKVPDSLLVRAADGVAEAMASFTGTP